jgi:hypothetical protein
MKRKTIYSLFLICCLGLLSSANQDKTKSGKENYCYCTKANCCADKAGDAVAEKNDSPAIPLNLFLFDL